MSLVRMCVIDDVKTVINGIQSRIPWETYGIEIVGAAVNGEEGLRLIKEKHPQIVLTDIRMPMKSGIDMVRELKECGEPAAKVIFISGYNDFAYAQESVKLGAFDYLLKPFTMQQVVDVVLKAKVQVEAELSEQHERIMLERKLRESLPYLREEYFRMLIRHDEQPEHAAAKWAFFGIDMEMNDFAAMAVQMDGLSGEAKSLSIRDAELGRFAVQNILEDTIRQFTKGVVFREYQGHFAAVLNMSSNTDLYALADACSHNVRKYAKCTVTIGVGGKAESVREIALSYEQAKTALGYQFYSGPGCVIHYSDINRQGGVSPHYSGDKETELLYCLRSGNKEGVLQLLESISAECLRYPAPPDPNAMTNMFYGLAFSMYRVIAEKADHDQRAWLDDRLCKLRNDHYRSTSALLEAVREIGAAGCEWLQSRQRNDVAELIHQAIAYIRGRLGDDLTVQECANAVHLSPSYFASVFKKETGTTFNQYVTSARMEKAKELLLEGEQVQDICFELGYKDRPYFSELFKKHTNLTPTEFRLKYGKKQGEGSQE